MASLLSKTVGSGDEMIIASRSMSFWVDATGLLRATSVQNFSAPPQFGNYWQFQIVSLAPEGKSVTQGDPLIGFDAQKAEYVNMIKAGIIDPTKVVRTALQGAVSVAGLLITTEAMVVEAPPKDAPAAMPGGAMGGGMGF